MKFRMNAKKRGKKRNTNFKRKVMAIVRPLTDNRYTYTTFGTTSVDANGAYLGVTQLLDTRLGDGSFAERQGDSITPTRLIMRYAWTAADAYNTCRLIVFQWKPDSNSFPPTAILNNVIDTSTLGSTNAPLSRYIFDQKNFHILHDSTITVCDGTSNQHIAKTVNIYGKKLRPIRYTDGVQLGHNNIYAIVISDSLAGPNPLFQTTMELHYKA